MSETRTQRFLQKYMEDFRQGKFRDPNYKVDFTPFLGGSQGDSYPEAGSNWQGQEWPVRSRKRSPEEIMRSIEDNTGLSQEDPRPYLAEAKLLAEKALAGGAFAYTPGRKEDGSIIAVILKELEFGITPSDP